MIPLIDFLKALHARSLLQVEFINSNGEKLQRLCVPLDYGPSKRLGESLDRYHFFDLHDDRPSHPMAILPQNVLKITPVPKTFDPSQIVTWKPDWVIPRDWGQLS